MEHRPKSGNNKRFYQWVICLHPTLRSNSQNNSQSKYSTSTWHVMQIRFLDELSGRFAQKPGKCQNIRNPIVEACFREYVLYFGVELVNYCPVFVFKAHTFVLLKQNGFLLRNTRFSLSIFGNVRIIQNSKPCSMQKYILIGYYPSTKIVSNFDLRHFCVKMTRI